MTSFHRRSYRWISALLASAGLLTVHAAPAGAAWPPLETVVRAARTQAPGIASARGAVGVARASITGARMSSILNPYVELRAEHGAPPGASTIAGSLVVPVEIGGQRGRRIDEASALAQWQEAELGGAESRAVGEAVGTYGEVLALAARLHEATAAVEDARLQAEWFTQRLTAGDATLSDQSLADAELGRWTQQRAEASIGLTSAATHLAMLTGQTEPVLPGAVDAAFVPALRVPWNPDTLAAAVERNPDVRARALETRHWDLAHERAEADRSPPINIVVTGGRGDLGEPRVGGGLGWSFPVLRRNEGRSRARWRSRSARPTSARRWSGSSACA